jgi:hypothetical protein
MGYRNESTTERFLKPPAVVPVTVGKIEELARHFRGEGAALLHRLMGFISLAEHRLLIRFLCERYLPHRSKTREPMSALGQKQTSVQF